MALNLSTLTNPATSGDVLAEALTTADFLEPVPVLRNLARGSQKGGDAKQDVALNQPKALPLIDGDGYLYCSGVANNYAAIADESALDVSGDLTLEADLTLADWTPSAIQRVLTKYNTGGTNNRSYQLYIDVDGNLGFVISSDGSYQLGNHEESTVSLPSQGIVDGQRVTIRAEWRASDGRLQFFYKTNGGNFTQLGTDQSAPAGSIHNSSEPVIIGASNGGASSMVTGAIHSAKIYASINDTNKVLDVDFTATNVRHGDTKFKCATGQVVTVNQSGNDPSTIIKKPVLRFDGTNDGLRGLFANNIDGGYMFAAFSVLGTGGGSDSRVFSVNANGAGDVASSGFVYGLKYGGNNDLAAYGAGGYRWAHNDMYDDARGDILYETKAKSGGLISKVNNANKFQPTTTLAIASNEFNVGNNTANNAGAAIDLEYLALFPATITDAQAADVVNYINNRNNVFDLKDGFGYYFFDPQALTDGDLNSTTKKLTGLWNGQIVGSDNGDTSFIASQGTSDDQPVGDGFKVTFADNTDHLEITNPNQAGWQVVGTSRGTFAYRVNNTAVTELNLLGNLGQTEYRKAGDLYGIILLPESATGADIESARSLLIDRGAADGTTSGTIFTNWYNRDDIVEFKHINTSSVTYASYAWYSCQALEKFPALDLSNSTTLSNAWLGCTVLSDFGAIQADSCTDFASAWKSCTSLASFPAGAKLGTAASSGVNFDSAWNSSGLTSFSTPLPTATSVSVAWGYCSALTQFNLDSLPVVLNVSQAWRNTGLTSFNTNLPSATSVSYAWYQDTSLSSFGAVDIKNCSSFISSWHNCSALTSFPAGAKLGTEAVSNVNFSAAWMNSGLTSFPPLDLSNATNFSNAFRGTAITQFPSDALLGTNKTNVNFNSAFRSSDIISFSTPLPTGNTFADLFKYCGDLTDVSVDVFTNWNPSTIANACFNDAWTNCASLTAQSVENILTSIDASGKYGTATGAAGGGSIDSGIDIDYDGTTLSAATNAAIDSLIGKGWEVFINGVLVIPNILDLQPAAAYSLRSFDASADPNVVNVRRSSDGATSDFTASEVSDGTLTSWVNTDVDLVTPTQANGGFEDGLTGWFSGSVTVDTNEFYAGTQSAKMTIIGGGAGSLGKSILQSGLTYRVGFWAKISDTTKQIRVEFGSSGNIELISFSSTDWEYKEVTKTANGGGIFFVRQTTSGDYSVNIDNVTVTQLTADGHVTTWYDQGGTNHATQPLEGYMPKLVDGGTLVTEGGKPALDFDGTDDYLQLTSNIFADNFEVAVVSHIGESTSTTFQRLLDISNGINNELMVVKSSVSSGNHLLVKCLSTDSSSEATSFGQNLINDQNLAYVASDVVASSYFGSVDGVASTISDFNGVASNDLTRSTIGIRSDLNTHTCANGTFQEIVLFNTDQSSNRTGIENNINDHFDIYS